MCANACQASTDFVSSALSPILVTPSDDPTETVKSVKDFKRRIPSNGRPYFARRCLTEEGREQYKTHWPMEILFNFLGLLNHHVIRSRY